MYLEPFRSDRGVHFHTSSSQRDGVLCSNSEGCASIDLGRKCTLIIMSSVINFRSLASAKLKLYICINDHIGPNR